MIKVMSFYSRTQRVYGWVSIIWFTSAVNVAVSQGVALQTISQVAARCGENVTLTCEATLSQQLDIKLFAWVAKNKTCHYEDHQPDPEVLCESTAKTPQHRLTLTLLNVMPVNQGEYLCKLRSKLGVKSATTVVTVQDCFEPPDSSINESHAKCCFGGVYPSGTIHWSQEDVNLTDSASTQEDEDQHGRYDVCSTLDVQRGNLSQPYKCSLWIPSLRKYLSSKELPMVRAQESSGSMAKLQGIFILVEIMTVTLMT